MKSVEALWLILSGVFLGTCLGFFIALAISTPDPVPVAEKEVETTVKHLDWVRVVNGFYRGTEGRAVAMDDGMIVVKQSGLASLYGENKSYRHYRDDQLEVVNPSDIGGQILLLVNRDGGLKVMPDRTQQWTHEDRFFRYTLTLEMAGDDATD